MKLVFEVVVVKAETPNWGTGGELSGCQVLSLTQDLLNHSFK